MRRQLFVIGFVGIVLVGCSEGRIVESTAGAVGAVCDLQGDCASGHVCLDGLCVTSPGLPGGAQERRCQLQTDCPGGEVCRNGVCGAPRGETPPSQSDPSTPPALDDKPAEDDQGPAPGGSPIDSGPAPEPEPEREPAPEPEPDREPAPAPEPEPEPAPDPLACEIDELEPDDVVADATPVVGDAVFEGMTLCQGDDVDLYRLDLEAGGSFAATVRNEAGEGPGGLRVELLEDDGETVVARSRGTPEGARAGLAAVPETGRYYLRVHGLLVPATYGLDIRAAADGPAPEPVGDDPQDDDGGEWDDGGDGCDDDIFEPNDDFASATEVGPGLIPLLEVCDGDPDLFAIELSPGDVLVASIGFDFEEIDLELALHAPDTTLLDLSEGLLWSETVETRAQVAGLYYVAVFPFEFVGSGGYLITFDVQ